MYNIIEYENNKPTRTFKNLAELEAADKVVEIFNNRYISSTEVVNNTVKYYSDGCLVVERVEVD
jgi:hypothetical protein